jgi:dihydrodipicolinate synthase/N-acetylneuraminate lyase
VLFILPALTFFDDDGTLDVAANERYALAASESEANRFLLFGSTGEGAWLTQEERRGVVSIWRRCIAAEKIVVCGAGCLPAEADEYLGMGYGYMVPPWPSDTLASLIDYLGNVGARVMLYSHPKRSPLVLNVDSLTTMRENGVLPLGVKLSKVGVGDLSKVRAALPSPFCIWDGSDRRVQASLGVGVDGVVSQMLATVAVSLALDDPARIQNDIDEVRASLDGHRSKRIALKQKVMEQVPGVRATTREP